jgi:diaminopimelate decarboxylase
VIAEIGPGPFLRLVAELGAAVLFASDAEVAVAWLRGAPADEAAATGNAQAAAALKGRSWP